MTTQVTAKRATNAAKPEERYLLISSDCHAGARSAVYREYLDPSYREQYDAWLAKPQAREMPVLAKTGAAGEKRLAAIAATEAAKTGGATGAWDAGIRTRELDREGITAEIIFPDGNTQLNGRPFFGRVARMDLPPDQYWAGARAHNRWLADFCSHQPERHAGVAVVHKDDVQQMIREMEWAKKTGLSGGVVLPNLGFRADEPEEFWHHPRYEPFWSACEDLDVPINAHSGGPFPNYGESPGSRWLLTSEAFTPGWRLFSCLMWGGVLERHPKLKVAITENGGGNVPYMLALFDYLARDRNPEALAQVIKLKPSEYWARQGYVGASPPAGRFEVEARDAIGVRNILWGSDYPHVEGTWPESDRRLRETFEGVPEDEVRLMAGENAAKVYGFDMKKLRPIAQRIGLQVGTFHEPGSAP